MPSAIIIALIPLLPLFSFLVLGLYGRKVFKNASGIIATVSLLASFLIAVYVAYGYFFINERFEGSGPYNSIIPFQYTWLQFNEHMSIDMGILLDPISVMMIV